MQAGALLLLVSASLAQYGPPSMAQNGPPQRWYGHGAIRKDELDQQQESFKQWWGDDLLVKLSDLPAEGKVPEFRVPYSGHDYPDRAGGTINALFKYDQAYHRNRPLATEFERMDVSAHRNGRSDEPVRGPFGRVWYRGGRGVPTWYGHCNGWTAAAIRHAEPQKNVVRNGITFTPADIKGLLAEIYMYTDSEFLGGIDPAINPAVLHLTLGNWIGRGSHPVGMETAVGEVVINFPVFNYKSQVNKLNARETELKTWITYTLNINREMDKGPPNYHRQMYFHYILDVDDEGAIRGGRYFGDSQQIDMLWTPRKPTQGGKEGNLRGNPHVDIKEVLAIWRESVPEDLRKKWLNIDPTDEDRLLPPSEAAVAVNDKPPQAASTEPANSGSSTVAAEAVVSNDVLPAPASASSAEATDGARSDTAAGSTTSATGATP
jgi:hypothetical protein